MALVLGIPLSISAIMTLSKILSSAGFTIYNVYDITNDGLESIKCQMSRRLADRSSAIAEILQHCERHILLTNLGRKMVQTLIDSIQWSYRYQKKNKLKKIINNFKYEEKFKWYHDAISQDMSDIAHTMQIQTYHINEGLNINENELSSINLKLTDTVTDITTHMS